MTQEVADLYSVLGVARRAGAADIEAAYAAWQARSAEFDNEAWERLRYAYEVLSNAQRRSLYDSLLAETTGAAAAALQVELLLSAATLPLLDTPQVLYALVTVTAAEAAAGAAKPLNLALVIDRSTSMRGERLEQVIAAVELLLDKLGPDDSLALVSFSDRAEVVLPAGTERGSRERLRQMVASGGTEIYQGLSAGLDELRRMAADDRTSHLILLTDGHTYGDAPACLRLAEQAAGEGIGLTAFGLGADWNDLFLDALVAPSGGQSAFVERAEDVIRLLEDRLKGLGAVYAHNVRLRPAWPAQLTLNAAFKLSPFAQPLPTGEEPIPLGDLEGRAPLSFLLEFHVAPQPISTRFKLPVELRYSAAGTGRPEQTAGQSAQLMVLADTPAAQPPAAIIEAARRLSLYRMQEKAWAEAESGQLETAAGRMRRLAGRYLETGDLRLARQAQLEAQRLGRMDTMSLEGRKLLKYGTRSLMGAGEP